MTQPTSPHETTPFGARLRDWRQRRRLTQMDLALEADISTRHLSFMETGRASPSRDMILRLSECLDLPLRERNSLLTAGGFAPVFADRPLDDPSLEAARQAVEMVINGAEPYPALAVDRHWNLVAANRPVMALMQVDNADLLRPPVNVLRLSLHPEGLAPRIVNFSEWRHHLLDRLRDQVAISGDTVLEGLRQELAAYPAPVSRRPAPPRDARADFVVPLQMQTEHGVLSMFSTTTVFGTPVDVTLSEIAIESFFPADRQSAEMLRALSLPPTDA